MLASGMRKAHLAAASSGRPIGLPPRRFALLVLSGLVQRATYLTQPDALQPLSMPS